MPTFASVTASIYPWDVIGDPAAADGVAALGIDRVTLPAVYHAVRATTMRHPQHRVVETGRTGVFTRFDTAAWPADGLRASDGSAWFGSPDAFGEARDLLQASGLTVDAWVVLMHADGVKGTGESHFRSAFGDLYDFALCPRGEGVLDYARRIVSSVAQNSGVTGMMLEACGSYGFTHLSEHDKTDSSGLTDTDRALLSVCFCPACREAMRERGLDDVAVAGRIVAAVGHTAPLLPTAPIVELTAAIRAAIGDDVDVIIALREDTNRTIRAEVIAEARAQGVERISFQASADPWSTGFSSAVLDPSPEIQVAIIDSTGPADRAANRLREMAAVFEEGSTHPRLGSFTAIDAASTAEQFAERWSAFAVAGASELHLYHAGLASSEALGQATAALSSLS